MAATGAHRIANKKGRFGKRHGHFHKAAKPLSYGKAFGRNKKRRS